MSDKKDKDTVETSFEDEKDKPWWTEVVKDVTAAGLATIFMTEEGVRGYLREKKLPKELISLFMEGFSRKKDGLYEMLTREFGKVLAKTDFNKELQKFLENHEVNIHARVSFKKKEEHHEKGN